MDENKEKLSPPPAKLKAYSYGSALNCSEGATAVRRRFASRGRRRRLIRYPGSIKEPISAKIPPLLSLSISSPIGLRLPYEAGEYILYLNFIKSIWRYI
ncbi:hypothetical protein INR49_018454 [Caranx melampygus]|nr:hypothetical protein INR49_018454 [Caranx melampygus]